jgi:hypothetical protein
MEEVNVPHVSGTPVWIVKVTAAVVTAAVLMEILDHWNSFDWVGRVVALALLVWLVLMPLSTIRRWRPKPFDWANLYPAYIVLILAIILFARA